MSTCIASPCISTGSPSSSDSATNFLCSVFYEDIKSIQEFSIRGCRCVTFSIGCQKFTTVNGSKIQIYSSLTFQLLTALHRHSVGVHNLV
jgi:WD40 repeat protein